MKKFLIIGFLFATANVKLQAGDQQPPTIEPAIPIPPTPLQESLGAILSLLQQQNAALITMQQQMGTQQQQTAALITMQQQMGTQQQQQQQTNLAGRRIYRCLFPGCGKSYTRNEYRQRHTAEKHPNFQPAIPAPAAIVQAPVAQEPIAPAEVQAPAIPAPTPIVQAPAAQKSIAGRPKINNNFTKLPDGSYQCNHCNHEPYKPNTLPGVLYHHINYTHGTPDKTYDCTICGKKYKQPYSLVRHQQSNHLQQNAAQVDDQVAAQVDAQVDDQVDD